MVHSRILLTACLSLSYWVCLGSAVLAQSITTDKFIYDRQATVTATFENAPGNRLDYVAVGYPGLPDQTFYHWTYTNGQTEGGITFTATFPPGRFEIRLYDGPSRQVVARNTFMVGGPSCLDEALAQASECAPGLRAPGEVMTGQPFAVGYEGGGTGRTPDFVTLVPAGTTDGQRGSQTLQLRDSFAGRHEFTIDAPGAYEVRFHVGGAPSPTARVALTAVAPKSETPARLPDTSDTGAPAATVQPTPNGKASPSGGPPTVATDRFIYETQDTIRIAYSGAPAKPNVSVAIGFPGRGDNANYNGQWLQQASEGEVQINARLLPGRYEARIFDGGSRTVLARTPFMIGGPNCLDPEIAKIKDCLPRLDVAPEFQMGEPIKVLYEGGGTGLRPDIITVVPADTRDGTWPRPSSIDLREAFAGEHVFRVDAPGLYEARFHVGAESEPVQRVAFEVLPFADDFRLNVERFYGETSDEALPDLWRSAIPTLGSGLTGNWLGELECSDRRRDTHFVLSVSLDGSAEATFPLGNSAVGLLYTSQLTQDSAELTPTGWTDARARLPAALSLAFQLTKSGNTLQGSVTGDPGCTAFSAARFKVDDREADSLGYVTAWENLGASAFTLERCVAVVTWMTDGEEHIMDGAQVPSQVLNSEAFRLITGIPFDQWDRRASNAHTAVTRHCLPLMSRSLDVAVTETIAAYQSNALVSHFLSLLASRDAGAPVTADGRFLQAYVRVVRIRHALESTIQRIAQLSALPPTEETLALWNAEVAALESGDELAGVLPQKIRVQAREQMQEARRTAAAEWILAEIAAAPTSLASIERISGSVDRVFDLIDVESAIATDIATAGYALMVNSLKAEIGSEIAALKISDDTLAGLEALSTNYAELGQTRDQVDAFQERFSGTLEIASRLNDMEVRAAETLDPLVATYVEAYRKRTAEIVQAAQSEFEAELADVASSYAALQDMQRRAAGLIALIAREAPGEEVAYRQLLKLRTAEIVSELAVDARRRLAAFASEPSGGRMPWEWAEEVAAFSEGLLAPFVDLEGYAEVQAEFQAALASEIETIAAKGRSDFALAVQSASRSWSGVAQLSNDRNTIAGSPHAAAFSGYDDIISQELVKLYDALEFEARQRVLAFGRSHRDIPALYELSRRERERFQAQRETARAEAIHAAANNRAAEVFRLDTPVYRAEISAIEATYEAVEELNAAAEGFDRDRSIHDGFKAYAALARDRAEAMLTELCDAALSDAGLTGELAEQPVLVSGAPVPARDFVCDLDRLGHDVREFASPGSLTEDEGVTFRVAERESGKFHYATLRVAEALPGQMVLIGARLGDAGQQEPINLEEWGEFLALLQGETRSKSVVVKSPKDVFDLLSDATVWIVAFTSISNEGYSYSSGTGSFIGPNTILTNAHVADNNGSVFTEAFIANQKIGIHRIRFVESDWEISGARGIDAAVYEVHGYTSDTYLSFANDHEVGAWIASAGYPGTATESDFKAKLTARAMARGLALKDEEIISPVIVDGRSNNIILDARNNTENLQFSMAAAKGASGSPVVNACGEIVALLYEGDLSPVASDGDGGLVVLGSGYTRAILHPHVEDFLETVNVEHTSSEKPCDIIR